MQFQQMPQQRGGMPMQQSYNGQTQYRMPAGGMQQGQQMRSMPQGMQQSQGFVQGGRQVQSMGGAMPQQQMMQRGGVMPQQSVPQHQHHQVKVVGASPDDGGLAGVGLFFQQLEGDTDRVYVKNILSGQSADREGTVQVNDEIEEVDGQPVTGAQLAELRAKILGEIGTFVTLKFSRMGDDGETYQYTVSLMRANAAYFSLIRDKIQMEDDVEKLRQTLAEQEEHLEALRKDLRNAEEASGAAQDKAMLEQLRGLLRQSEESLRNAQAMLKAEHMSRREMESKQRSIAVQKEQDTRDLDQLRGWLNQAQDKLAAAHESLKMTRQQKAEQDERYRDEQAKRVSAEEQERKLMQEAEERMEADRKMREKRETELLALEEDRRRYEKLYREEAAAVSEIVRKREIIEARIAKSDAQRAKIQSDNERLEQMLKEAEEARVTIENAKKETEEKNAAIEEEIARLEEEARKGAKYIEELKAKLEQERVRWEAALRAEQDGRKEDNQRFKAREDELLSQIAKLTDETRRFKEEAEDKRRKLETAVMRLEQENKNLEAALKAEESLAEALRERLSVLGEQVSKTEQELADLNKRKDASEVSVQDAETDKLKALERERAMDAELQKEKQAEPEKLEAIEKLKKELEEKRLEAEKALHAEITLERATLISKEEADHALRRFRDDGQLMVDNERRRLEREKQFQTSHEEMTAQFKIAFEGQADLSKVMQGIKLPVKELEEYLKDAHIFDDTDPKTARPDNSAALHHLHNGTPAQQPQVIHSQVIQGQVYGSAAGSAYGSAGPAPQHTMPAHYTNPDALAQAHYQQFHAQYGGALPLGLRASGDNFGPAPGDDGSFI